LQRVTILALLVAAGAHLCAAQAGAPAGAPAPMPSTDQISSLLAAQVNQGDVVRGSMHSMQLNE
jgi:hypothetical protein